MAERTCSVADCDGIASAKGWCQAHYTRWWRTGDTLADVAVERKSAPLVCRVDECDVSGATRRGLCPMHYARWRRNGSTDRREPSVWQDPKGYCYTQRTGHPNADNLGRISVHRLVMSEFLGRPLLPGEEVHHLNGDRADNRVENLELWTKSQPAGARVEDKVRWAIELLATYEPERLAP
jgi:hypothetical protein